MTPAAKEAVVNTTDSRIHLGDGLTPGGIPHANFTDVQNQTFVYATVGGTGNAITLTNSPAKASRALGQRGTFKAGSSNSTAVTIDEDGLGAVSAKYMVNGALAAIPPGGIVSGGIYEHAWDGTQYQLFGIGVTAVSPGSLVYLGTRTASNSANIQFTGLMSSLYDDYLVVLDHVYPASSGVNLLLTTSNNNGSSYASSDYCWTKNTTSTTASVITNGADDVSINIAANIFGSGLLYGALNGKIELFGTNSGGTATAQITWNVCWALDNSNAGIRMAQGANLRRASEAVNAIEFAMSTGNIASGIFKLYGVAKA
jgi:hypothetical protein